MYNCMVEAMIAGWAKGAVVIKVDAWVQGLLAEGPKAPRRALVYRWSLILAIIGSTMTTILDTVPGVWGAVAPWVAMVELAGLVLMTLDYGLRLRMAGELRAEDESAWVAMGRYALSPYGIFDFLAVVPFLLGELVGLTADGATIFGLLRFLKLARYSPALETLGAVVINELRPLGSALFIVILLALSAATALYFAERHANPHFATMPDALWWAIVTLTTVGYGDVVPVTALGKMLNGAVAVLGLCMFALPASILASGFAEEMRRHDFVANWQLVARVPFFARLHANQIAEIAAMLRPFRAVRGEVVVREGDMGEAMFFIVTGQVEGSGRGGRFTLKAGEFFGEIALIERRPRTATIKAMTRCQFLVLDSRDFQKIVAGYPDLLEIIWETARQRLAHLDAAVATTDAVP